MLMTLVKLYGRSREGEVTMLEAANKSDSTDELDSWAPYIDSRYLHQSGAFSQSNRRQDKPQSASACTALLQHSTGAAALQGIQG